MLRRTFLVVLVFVAACEPAMASPTPSVTPGAPGNPGAIAGPLALHRTDGAMEARNEGVLVITERCTFLAHNNGERETLAWPSDRTAWDAATASIRFQTTSGEVVNLRNGDQLVLGGGGSSRQEDGLTGAEWARRLAWVVPPALECLADTRWEVGDVEPPAR